jgi:hypothetical protein
MVFLCFLMSSEYTKIIYPYSILNTWYLQWKTSVTEATKEVQLKNKSGWLKTLKTITKILLILIIKKRLLLMLYRLNKTRHDMRYNARTHRRHLGIAYKACLHMISFDLKFPQRLWWRFKSSGTLWCVILYTDRNLSPIIANCPEDKSS